MQKIWGNFVDAHCTLALVVSKNLRTQYHIVMRSLSLTSSFLSLPYCCCSVRRLRHRSHCGMVVDTVSLVKAWRRRQRQCGMTSTKLTTSSVWGSTATSGWAPHACGSLAGYAVTPTGIGAWHHPTRRDVPLTATTALQPPWLPPPHIHKLMVRYYLYSDLFSSLAVTKKLAHWH